MVGTSSSGSIPPRRTLGRGDVGVSSLLGVGRASARGRPHLGGGGRCRPHRRRPGLGRGRGGQALRHGLHQPHGGTLRRAPARAQRHPVRREQPPLRGDPDHRRPPVRRAVAAGARLRGPPARRAALDRRLRRRGGRPELHDRVQRLLGRPHRPAGLRAVLGPPGAAPAEGPARARRHLEHAELPRPDRQERRVDRERRPEEGRRRHRGRRPRLGHLAGVEVLRRSAADRGTPDQVGHLPHRHRDADGEGRRRRLHRRVPAR